jgi:perosamine synthetase
MIPRGKIDITCADILAGIYYCIADFFKIKQNSENSENKHEFSCLSVRTGFDLLLSALSLPAGSEILVTDINIPDMFNIIAAHQLTAVPLPLNRHTLNVTPQQVTAAITSNTKAILVTHLFGGIMEIDEIAAIAKKNSLVLIEDCAQAYVGDVYKGNNLADVVMFSFGLIKTHTSVSGALLQINGDTLYHNIVERNRHFPVQRKGLFFKKLCKVGLMKILTTKAVYTLFYNSCVKSGKDFDQVLSGFTRGFPGEDILQKIRFRPCAPNLNLLAKRTKNFDPAVIDQRKKLAADILKVVPATMQIGALNKRHSYWVLPIQTNAPDKLIAHLRVNGFDATQKASSLVKLSSGQVADTDLLLDKLVYLPVYVDMKSSDRVKLANLLKEFKQ